MITEAQLEAIARDALRRNGKNIKAIARDVTRVLNDRRKMDLRDEAHKVMAQHHPEADNTRSGCSCGFCVYSVEHVVLMFADHIAEKS